jgi:hypothetical protein
MRVHDYQLRAYEVTESGSVIVLDLVYDYAGQPKIQSRVRFSGVELYHFTHTMGSILFGIEEVALDELLEEQSNFVEVAATMYGIRGWQKGIDQYRDYLDGTGAKAWEITSSIGFDGFVIAGSLACA